MLLSKIPVDNVGYRICRYISWKRNKKKKTNSITKAVECFMIYRDSIGAIFFS